VAFDDGDGQLDKRVEYTYDVFNQLIGKTVDDDGDGNPDRAEIYVWDRGQILLDFVDDNAGDGLDDFEVARRYLHGPLVDQVLAQEDAATGDVDWLLADHQATIRDLVRWDDANTETDYIQQYQYDTFGNLVAITDITGTVDYTDRSYAVTRYQYTGRDWDADSGLQYNRMRWYDPATGRWINEDPIGFAGGDANLVSYADNAVTIFVDPSGLKVFWVKRRLDGLPVGNHGYLLIIPDEPDKFSGLIDVYGGKKGFTLGGHRGADDDDKGCLILISNQKADVAAVREFHDSDRYEKEEKRADEGEDSDYYKSKWQHAQNEIEPPKGMTDTE
jgi:RHS repeat-associated protein